MQKPYLHFLDCFKSNAGSSSHEPELGKRDWQHQMGFVANRYKIGQVIVKGVGIVDKATKDDKGLFVEAFYGGLYYEPRLGGQITATRSSVLETPFSST